MLTSCPSVQVVPSSLGRPEPGGQFSRPKASATIGPVTAKNLRIEETTSAVTVGVCELCNRRFRSFIQPVALAEWEIAILFERHKCEKLPVIPPGKKRSA
jgi:hypothetical protein